MTQKKHLLWHILAKRLAYLHKNHYLCHRFDKASVQVSSEQAALAILAQNVAQWHIDIKRLLTLVCLRKWNVGVSCYRQETSRSRCPFVYYSYPYSYWAQTYTARATDLNSVCKGILQPHFPDDNQLSASFVCLLKSDTKVQQMMHIHKCKYEKD